MTRKSTDGRWIEGAALACVALVAALALYPLVGPGHYETRHVPAGVRYHGGFVGDKYATIPVYEPEHDETVWVMDWPF